MTAPPWRWRGRLPYAQALDEQRAWREGLRQGRLPEEIWLLEHDPVVTTGRRAVPDLDLAALAARGIPVVPTERGGLATWHGPGQLVAYLLIDAGGRGLGPRVLVERIEQVVIDWLAEQGLPTARRPGLAGVWAGHDKLCAVGLHLAQGFTMHGLALNLDPDLSAYGWFTPCGVAPQEGAVSSVARLMGQAPRPEAAAAQLGPRLSRAVSDLPSLLHLTPPEGNIKPDGPAGA